MCKPYGGLGTIPARVLATWMSDPEYRRYYNATAARDRAPGAAPGEAPKKKSKLGAAVSVVSAVYKAIGRSGR